MDTFSDGWVIYVAEMQHTNIQVGCGNHLRRSTMGHLLLEPVFRWVGMYSGKDVQIMKSVKVIEIYEIN